jgi:hypothetical protein
MNQVSKDAFKSVMDSFKEFETLGNNWCDKLDIGSAAKARSYAKKILGDMRVFVEATINESNKIASEAFIQEAAKVVLAEVPKEVVEEVKVVKEVIAPVAAKVVEAVKTQVAPKADPLPSFSSPKDPIKK